MSQPEGISYFNQTAIDKTKWDRCIEQCSNGLIYGYSFYLDEMSPGWDALVYKDYELVMPLTWKRKWGIKYLYQPFLTAQLGVFGNNPTPTLVDQFIQSIPRQFKLTEICLNSRNTPGNKIGLVTKRNNYVLPLNKSYEELYSNYSENTQRNSKKAAQAGCTVSKDINPEEVIRLALQQMQGYGKESAENVNRFRRLYSLLAEKKMTTTYGICNSSGAILASCIFFFSHNRAYYILVGNHPDSRNTGASHALIDAFIKDHAGKNLLLDFEGSDIPGLATFYSSFGAVNDPYPFLKINRLPFFLKWMKN